MNYQRVEISLTDGRLLSCDCYIVSSSTRGAVLYTPLDRATRNFIKVAEREGKQFFGERPVIVVPPILTNDEQQRPNLPPYRFIGEFISQPFKSKNCWSRAIVVWYQNSPYPIIGEDAEVDFRLIDWDAIAVDQSIKF